MKVAMVFDGLGFGGIERVGTDYAKIFKSLGYDVTIINLNPNQKEMLEKFPDDIHYCTFKLPRNVCPERYAQLSKNGAVGSIIYAVMFMLLSVLIFAYKSVFKFTNRNIFLNKYDVTIAFSGHFNDLTFVSSEFVKSEKKVAWLHGALYGYLLISSGFLRLYKKIVNLVVLVDDAQTEALMYNSFPKLSITKIYNPVSMSVNSIRKSKVNDLTQHFGKFILMVSRFEFPHKDHYTVVDAFEKLIISGNKEYSLVFVGDGPDSQKVKDYVISKGESIASKVYFVGSVKDVENYYTAADILVHASVAGEGLPTVLLEAMKMKTPVVCTDSKVGPREIIGNDQYGLLTRVQDPEDMANKLDMLINDRKLYYSIVNSAVNRVNDFSVDKIKQNISDYLEALCGE